MNQAIEHTMITRERLVQLAKELIAIPSFTGSEHAIAQYVATFLRNLGIESIEVPVPESGPTIIGYLRGGDERPPFMLNFHLDTTSAEGRWTSDPLEPFLQGNLLYGLGAHDMKGGAACILAVAEVLVNAQIRLNGTLVISATSDEERWSRGAHALIEGEYLRGIAGCLIPEPTLPYSLRIGGRGRHLLRLEVTGKSGPAAYDQRGGEDTNAIHCAIAAVNGLESLKLSWNQRYQIGESFQVTYFVGGTKESVSRPVNAVVEINFHRVSPRQSLATLRRNVAKIIEDQHLPCQFHLYWDDRPTPAPLPYRIQRSLLTQSALRHMRNVTGRSRIRQIVGESVCDSNHFVAAGIPTLVYGPDGGNTSGGPDEYVMVDSMEEVARVYLRVVADLLR